MATKKGQVWVSVGEYLSEDTVHNHLIETGRFIPYEERQWSRSILLERLPIEVRRGLDEIGKLRHGEECISLPLRAVDRLSAPPKGEKAILRLVVETIDQLVEEHRDSKRGTQANA